MTLHDRFLVAIKSERKFTLEVLTLINEAEVIKYYLKRGHSSMFCYLTKELGYSEGSAYRRLESARLLRSTSGLSESLNQGEINLSQTALLQSAIKQQQKISEVSVHQKNTLLNRIKGLNQTQTKRILQETFPEVKWSTEKLAPRSEGKTLISFEVSEEELKLIEQAKSILSHTCPEQKTKEVFLKLCEKLVKAKINPQQRKSVQTKNDNENNKALGKTDEVQKLESDIKIKSEIPKAREPISTRLRREIFMRADYQCEFKNHDTHHRCESRVFLEIDHIKPVAFGGTSHPENLRVLCRAHNQYLAEEAGIRR
jgi:hypothetical protein